MNTGINTGIPEYIKPREYGEPIHEESPGFNPTQHENLITELNRVIHELSLRVTALEREAGE